MNDEAMRCCFQVMSKRFFHQQQRDEDTAAGGIFKGQMLYSNKALSIELAVVPIGTSKHFPIHDACRSEGTGESTTSSSLPIPSHRAIGPMPAALKH